MSTSDGAKFSGHGVMSSAMCNFHFFGFWLTLPGLYQKPKSFVSCSHMNCCLQNILHINLHILYIIQVKTS